MNWIEVIVLAAVEGLTEFLPVSSTGHMIIVSKLMNLPHSDFLGSFEIIVQVGAILAVLFKYWTLLWRRKDYWPLIMAAFIPTSVVGFLGYSLIKKFFLGNVEITMMGLLIGGLILVVVEKLFKNGKDLDQMNWRQSFFVGLLQTLAIIPGVSRSASTIIGGQIVGLSRKAAVEFSFLLGLPVLMAAAGYDLLKVGFDFSTTEWSQLIVGIGIAFVVARLSVNWLIGYVEKRSLAVFGWYRIVLALIYFTSLWVAGH